MVFLISIKSDGAGQFTAEMQKVEASAQRTGAAMQQAGARSGGFIQAFKDFGKALLPAVGFAAAGYALQSLVRNTLAWADATEDASHRLGVSTDAVQQWERAAKRTGLTIEDISQGMRSLRRTIGEAVQGKKEAIGALHLLGVKTDDFKARRPDEIFNSIMRFLGKSNLSAVEFAAGLSVLGRSADRLYGAAQQGFAEIAKNAKNLMPTEQVLKLAEAEKSWQRIGAIMRVVIAPCLVWMVERLRDLVDYSRVLAATWEGFALRMLTGPTLSLFMRLPGRLGKKEDEKLAEILTERVQLQRELEARIAAAKAGAGRSEWPEAVFGKAAGRAAGGDQWQAMGLFGLHTAAAHIVSTQTDYLRQIAEATRETNRRLMQLTATDSPLIGRHGKATGHRSGYDVSAHLGGPLPPSFWPGVSLP